MTAAMLLHNQIILRCVFLCRQALHIVCCLAVLSPPLCDAALASLILAMATVYGLARLLRDRSRVLVRSEQLPFLDAMGGIEPRAYCRRLMRLGHRRVLPGAEVLTRKGVARIACSSSRPARARPGRGATGSG